MFQKGFFVRLHTDDEWNGQYGMICDVSAGVIAVFCVAMPLYKYYVRRDGSETQILEPVNF